MQTQSQRNPEQPQVQIPRCRCMIINDNYDDHNDDNHNHNDKMLSNNTCRPMQDVEMLLHNRHVTSLTTLHMERDTGLDGVGRKVHTPVTYPEWDIQL